MEEIKILVFLVAVLLVLTGIVQMVGRKEGVMEKKKIKALGFLVIISLILTGIVWIIGGKGEKSLSYEKFKQQVQVKETSDILGINITLHQTIHGTDHATYRYKLKSDCPHWQYEDRYVSETPLKWKGKKPAVEAEATSLQVRLKGDVLAQGQHFYVPLLDLNSEDITVFEYRENLIKTAYKQYQTTKQNVSVTDILMWIAAVLATIVVLLFIIAVTERKKLSPKEKDPFEKQVVLPQMIPLSQAFELCGVTETERFLLCHRDDEIFKTRQIIEAQYNTNKIQIEKISKTSKMWTFELTEPLL